MKSNLPDRSLIREYLLGRLDNEKELEERLSHDIFSNDELSDVVESIEEEIIEDFLALCLAGWQAQRTRLAAAAIPVLCGRVTALPCDGPFP
jgi:hypothetical protein